MTMGQLIVTIALMCAAAISVDRWMRRRIR